MKTYPLKWVDFVTGGFIRISAEALSDLFFALSLSKMERINMRFLPNISKNTSESDIVKMGEGFTEFLKTQTNLSYLVLGLGFGGSEKKANIVPFSYIPSFISDHKEEIKNYHEFDIRINGLLFFLL